LGERALEARKRVLGEEHPDILSSMSNLVSTYQMQGRIGEAAGLEERALATRRQGLGEEHPET
jgi:hypothetical protein